MDNELSQLDALIESDVLDALGETSKEVVDNSADELGEPLIEEHQEDEEITNGHSEIEDIEQDDFLAESDSLQSNQIVQETSQSPLNSDQDMSSTSLSKLLSELLNNKTIEITIKVKE